EAARVKGLPTEIECPGTLLSRSELSDAAQEAAGGNRLHLTLTEEDGSLSPLEVSAELTFTPASLPEGGTDEAKARVLIVDDSPVMQAFLEKIFRENGYEVVGTASDGVEAIELFESTRPDLMTLDIIMPKLKGTEVLERILESHPEAKVVMASSVSDARTVMKCLKIGAKRYILKPYDGDAVIEAVEKALNLSSES
ncbi:MAG: response regulator, partial [Planctomycetota bacterium]